MSLRETLAGGGGGLPGGMTKDPTLLGVYDATNTIYSYPVGSGSLITSSAAAFWSSTGGAFGQVAAVSTSATANVYGTVCNITGKGALLNVLSPLISATTDTVSFRITVDDIVSEIIRIGSWKSFSPGGRVVMGPLFMGANAEFTSVGEQHANYAESAAAYPKDRIRSSSTNPTLLQPWKALREGVPMTYFEKNLKVETKVSALGVDTYAQYSGASYVLFG